MKLLDKFCKKCQENTKHRFVNDKRKGYYSCKICLKNNSKNHRNRYWLRYLAQKANARKRKNSIKITEEILQIIYKNQDGKCALTGISFKQDDINYKPSLDRIDSTKGYYPNNLQLVLCIVNKIKREFDQKLFIDICQKISNYHDQCLNGVCGL